MKFQIPLTNLKGKVIGAVGYTALISFFILVLSTPLNNLFKSKYGKHVSDLICDISIKVPSQYRFLFFQICSSTEDLKITPEEFAAIIISSIENSEIKTALKETASKSEEYRKTIISQSVNFGITEYQSKMKKAKYVDTEKPSDYFEDVYKPNNYNEEQIVLLEQAKYTEHESDDSYAQKVLGPKRELTYVGLKFPYQGGLTD